MRSMLLAPLIGAFPFFPTAANSIYGTLPTAAFAVTHSCEIRARHAASRSFNWSYQILKSDWHFGGDYPLDRSQRHVTVKLIKELGFHAKEETTCHIYEHTTWLDGKSCHVTFCPPKPK